MIFKKFWGAIRAQLNKVANLFWEADPIAQMQYEYDLAVEQLKEGRQGLEQYRGLVERVSRQVKDGDAQVAKLSQSLNFDVSTDFGQLEDIIQRRIDANRGKVRVAADLSNEGIDKIQAEERMEKSMADDALKDLEVELGMRAPETTPITAQTKDLGPAEDVAARKQTDKQTEKA